MAYQRVFVESGQSIPVEFSTPWALSYFDAGMKTVVEAVEFTFMVGGSSADTNFIKASHLVKRISLLKSNLLVFFNIDFGGGSHPSLLPFVLMVFAFH